MAVVQWANRGALVRWLGALSGGVADDANAHRLGMSDGAAREMVPLGMRMGRLRAYALALK